MSVTGFNRRRRLIAVMREKAEAEIMSQDLKTDKRKPKQSAQKKAKEGAE